MLVRFALSITAAALVAVLFAIAPGAASAASPSAGPQAERYFSCPSGYAFRTSSDAAHCKKSARYQYDSLMPCVSLFVKTDAIGDKDMCTATNPLTGQVAVERGCRIGFSKRIIRGTDQCRKYIPGDIVAPSVEVTR
jgi:hypothetical protein